MGLLSLLHVRTPWEAAICKPEIRPSPETGRWLPSFPTPKTMRHTRLMFKLSICGKSGIAGWTHRLANVSQTASSPTTMSISPITLEFSSFFTGITGTVVKLVPRPRSHCLYSIPTLGPKE